MARPVVAPTLRLVALASVVLAGCGGSELSSTWRNRELRVDGALEDWQGLQVELPKAPARLGIANDGEALWLSLVSDDPAWSRALARRGFTVWIDPEGGHEQVVGVRFLFAGRAFGSRHGEPRLPGDGSPPRRQAQGDQSRGQRWPVSPLVPELEGIELLGPAPYTRRWMAPTGGDGVAVAVQALGGGVVYELRLPLDRTAGWGLGIVPGARVGLGFVASRPELAFQRGDRPPGGRGPGGDRGPGPGGGRRPGGGGPGGLPGGGGSPGLRGGGRDQPVEAWAKLHLATPPTG